MNVHTQYRSRTFSLSRALPHALKVCAVGLSALLLAACSKDQAGGPPRREVEVGVVTLQPRPVVIQSELAGRTTASLMSEVRPQVAGIIKSRRFEEGAQVKAGQVLYEIDPATYQAAYDAAKADLANAQAGVSASRLKDERYSELRAIEGVSQQEADDAHTAHQQSVATVEQRRAALESARIDLDYTKVRAPISGRIGKSAVTPGALVTANQADALATIRSLDPIYVDLTQSSADLLKLRRMIGASGMQSGSATVHLKLEDGSEYPAAGSMKFQEVAVDEATGSVTLRAQFPNPNGVLLPGMYVRAVLDQAVNSAAILAPQQGVTHDAKGKATALVVGAGNRVEQRTLVAERTIGDQWLISEGLDAGDRLIVEGTSKIHVGDTVKPVETAGALAGPVEGALPQARL